MSNMQKKTKHLLYLLTILDFTSFFLLLLYFQAANQGIVMVNFNPPFINCPPSYIEGVPATVQQVAGTVLSALYGHLNLSTSLTLPDLQCAHEKCIKPLYISITLLKQSARGPYLFIIKVHISLLKFLLNRTYTF